jgi:hypothetical protein
MKHHLAVVILGAAVAVVFWAGALIGGNHKYVEYFTTTQYENTLNTTACWDTVVGELKLHPFKLELAGSYNPLGPCVLDIAVSGDCAYVVDEDSLVVIDISNPENPARNGSCYISGTPRGVVLSGDYAYVANGNEGLCVVSITDPGNPSIIENCDPLSGHAYAVDIAGDCAYVANGEGGLLVLDITDPASLSLAGSYDTPGTARDVAVSGNYAYVSDEVSLVVVDINDPPNPTHEGACLTPGDANRVAISGDYAYVADYYSGLLVIDISAPDSPMTVVSCIPPSLAYDVTISGDYAYVAGYSSGLQVIDISDPTSPTLLNTCDMPDSARVVTVSGDYAYVGAGQYLAVVDVADQRDPLMQLGSCNTPGTAYSVTTDGDHAFVADGASGLQVIDISNPASPTIVGDYNTPGTAYDLAIEGDCAYVADYDQGLRIIDVVDPTTPTQVGSYVDGRREFNGIAISGNNAYVSDYTDGLLRFNITNPANPSYTGAYTYTGNPPTYGVAISGDYAYIAYGPIGLVKVDVSTGLSFVGMCSQAVDARGVDVSWYYAYVADGVAGLRVADVRSMTSVGHYDTPGTAYGIAVSGNYAFVADGSSGLHMIDITNPANPTLLRSYTTSAEARDVTISGDYAFVADGSSGIEVIKVFERGFHIGANEAWSLAIDDSDETIAGAKLTTSQSDSIRWELSADGGTNWQEVTPDDNLHTIATSGSDLLWRSTHIQLPPYTGNPTCTYLEIEWLFEAAVIDSIQDISNDQGRQVRVTWSRSGYDFLGSSLPITEYAIYREIDDSLAMALDFTRLGKETLSNKITPVDRDRALLYPPGDWDFVLTVPADCEQEYAAVVPTLKDSTITEGIYYTTFFVRARTATPGVYFDCVPDSGYSVDNLAPGVPAGFAVAYNREGGNLLSWEESFDEDFQHFRIYRDTNPDFIPVPENLQHATIDTNWLDTVSEGWKYYYKITAVDFSGNESDPTWTGSVTAVKESPIPQVFALYQNVPNPFNPITVIRYDVPAGGGKIALRIYDVGGRLITTLVDEGEGPGEKSVTWDGTNDRGRLVASGVYFYRLTSETFTKTRKMVLMK